MTIQFVLLVNKQGQTRLAQYTNFIPVSSRVALEGDVTRKCLARREDQCSFIEYMQYKLIYRRYASLFFIVGVDKHENELAILEFIHCLVETFDKYFENVCELDVMFNIDKAHFILEEMVGNGCLIETNTTNILETISVLDKYSAP
jgi:AP-4 complex subunit sigma-1